ETRFLRRNRVSPHGPATSHSSHGVERVLAHRDVDLDMIGRVSHALCSARSTPNGDAEAGVKLVLVLAAIGLASPGDRLVEFARSRMGQRVGDGQCSTLAREALRAAGARGRRWGEQLPSLKDARPGDILQFRDATFVRRRVLPDGAVVTLTFKYP